jgi:hypothetical protein
MPPQDRGRLNSRARPSRLVPQPGHQHQQRAITTPQPKTWKSSPQGDVELMTEKEVLVSSRRRDLNRLATYVPSRWTIASIASDDALILPHRANPAGSNFREPQVSPRR